MDIYTILYVKFVPESVAFYEKLLGEKSVQSELCFVVPEGDYESRSTTRARWEPYFSPEMRSDSSSDAGVPMAPVFWAIKPWKLPRWFVPSGCRGSSIQLAQSMPCCAANSVK